MRCGTASASHRRSRAFRVATGSAPRARLSAIGTRSAARSQFSMRRATGATVRCRPRLSRCPRSTRSSPTDILHARSSPIQARIQTVATARTGRCWERRPRRPTVRWGECHRLRAPRLMTTAYGVVWGVWGSPPRPVWAAQRTVGDLRVSAIASVDARCHRRRRRQRRQCRRRWRWRVASGGDGPRRRLHLRARPLVPHGQQWDARQL